MDENSIGKVVVDAAITVHREVGPGLLETVYELVLLDELLNRGLVAKRQVPIPINIRGVRFDEGFRADIIVENKVILELKCVEKTSHAHKKQLLTYLKLSGMKLGYLLNFAEGMMKDGIITRTVNGLPEDYNLSELGASAAWRKDSAVETDSCEQTLAEQPRLKGKKAKG